MVMVHTRSNGVFGSSGRSEGSDGSAGTEHKTRSKKKESELGIKECKAKMLKLLGMRDYTKKMMRDKLLSAGFPEEVVEETIDFGVGKKLLNDNRFADFYISAKQEAGWGKQRIERELEEKGVDLDEVPGYPDEYFDDDAEVERAISLVKHHRVNSKNVRESHYRYLLSKGYSPSIASKALRACGIDR
ncbi:MAG: regulatory protein RecX [Coriobacteriales bacterium]|jgi:regulatory protein